MHSPNSASFSYDRPGSARTPEDRVSTFLAAGNQSRLLAVQSKMTRPRDYDREFTTIVDRRAQIRAGLSTEVGDVTRFFVQLEYWLDGEWLEVVRFDHDPDSELSHDVTEEGLHMDVYRDGEKYRVKDDFPPVELNRAPRYCTMYIQDHADRLIRRFEQWHNVNDRDR